MPEGDTLYRTAENLRKAMLGKTVSRFESILEPVREADSRRGIAGRTVHAVEARGKHLLIQFRKPTSDYQIGDGDPLTVPERLHLPMIRSDSVLHTHLRMTGSWHIYRPGEIWRKPVKYAKCVIHTADFVFPCFSAPVVELLTARETARHAQLAELGPDAMSDEFDPESALWNLRRHPDAEIGVALMNQRLLAGVGNVYKSEVLFIRRIWPWCKVRELTEDQLKGLIAESNTLLKLNRMRGDRRTHFSLNDSDLLWVYGRSGRPCRACGTLIRVRRQGLEGRVTFFCLACQALPAKGTTDA